MVTEKIAKSHSHPKYISYSRVGDSLIIMVSHATTWELNGMRNINWSKFCESIPNAEAIQFEHGDHLLVLDPKTNTWKEVRD
jgi:hypothetical protein